MNVPRRVLQLQKPAGWLSAGLIGWLAWLCVSLPALAAPCPAAMPGVAVAESKATQPAEASQAISLTQDRTRRSLNQLFVFEQSPLGDRTPVIIVPGRAEEFQNNAWWERFEDYTQCDAFNQRYKLYVFIYNSKDELDVQALDLEREIQKRFADLPPERKLMLVTYSLGGVITREVLRNPDLLARTDTIFGIAVPFHGSPIFDPDWFANYLQPANRSPVRKVWDQLIYRAYLFNKTNLTRGLKWNNFDGSKPQFRVERDVHGDQIIPSIAGYEELATTRAIKDKLIVYASYLENGYTNTHQPMNPRRLPLWVLDKSVALPRELVASVLPVYGLTVHSVFSYTNHQLANLPTYSEDSPKGGNTHLYRFNDGAIPLSSMLFLPPRKTPYSDDFYHLIDATDVRQARVFVNLDHMHIGGYSPFNGTVKAKDLLSPQEGTLTPHQWILYDLMRLAGAECAESTPKDALKEVGLVVPAKSSLRELHQISGEPSGEIR